ncbi:Aldehyde/histidinol dehydrogenase, partial [Mycena rosella]
SFRKGLTRLIEWRKHQLLQLARMMQDNGDAFAESLAKDLGKPRIEMYFSEIVSRSPAVRAHYGDSDNRRGSYNAVDWQKPWKPTVYKGAKGIILIIASPLKCELPSDLSLQPLLGAIAAGCCAGIKPSELAPHYAELLVDLLPKYLDSNNYRVMTGAVAESTKL